MRRSSHLSSLRSSYQIENFQVQVWSESCHNSHGRYVLLPLPTKCKIIRTDEVLGSIQGVEFLLASHIHKLMHKVVFNYAGFLQRNGPM